MKRTLYSICIGTVLLALTASGAPSDKQESKGKGRGKARAEAPARSKSTVKTSNRGMSARTMTRGNVQNRSNFKTRTSSDAMVQRNVARQNKSRVARAEKFNTSKSVAGSRNNVAVNRERNFTTKRAVRAENNVAVNRSRNLQVNRTRNIEVNRNRNVTVTNNWRGDRFSGRDYAVFRDYRRVYHNRNWYHHNHSRIVFIWGAPWYWSTGYWYPAWGYSDYAYYPYDGPIYTGYATLTPDRMVINVQEQLARDGYYTGPIDGDFGPMTREAVAAFQADHGLAITSTIDRPTLNTLGLS